MKMRLVWYAAASAALAGGVVLSAFHQRANFYSAMVHLAQSSLSLMILVNFFFLIYGGFVYSLQRLCYGPLRPVEVEQLYEKAWFAITETCLAMTIFREEVGAFFLFMFTILVTGKVWGWIGEGRVEVFEQQPPANPRLFHTRLSISLLLSVAYDIWLLSYAATTVYQQARPTMMVMFLFEFGILTVCSCQTGLRYIITLVEQRIVRTQTRQRLQDRQRQLRESRADILRRREQGDAEALTQELPDDDVDEMDIEVPGWEAKGFYVLTLDLVSDFLKLGIYVAFFGILFTFYGLPIHIMRDLFMTTRSFLKRLSTLLRYRQALKEMGQYPDATSEELGREDTCIICREEMRPWDPDAGHVERIRAKKLPCGHILHFGCLKSWLERQQVCPTCRRPVTANGQAPAGNGDAVVQVDGPAQGGQEGGVGGQNNRHNNRNPRYRVFHFGPVRVGFAQGGQAEIERMVQRLEMGEGDNRTPPAPPQTVQAQLPPSSLDQIRLQIHLLTQRIHDEMQTLAATANEVHTLQFLANEVGRLRQMAYQHANLGQMHNQQPQPQPTQAQQPPVPPVPQVPQVPQVSGPAAPADAPPGTAQDEAPMAPPHVRTQPIAVPANLLPANPLRPYMPMHPPVYLRHGPTVTRHGRAAQATAIPAGSPELPEGVIIPPGWSLLPLQRLDGAGTPLQPSEHTTINQQAFQSTATEMRRSESPSLQNGARANGGADLDDSIQPSGPASRSTVTSSVAQAVPHEPNAPHSEMSRTPSVPIQNMAETQATATAPVTTNGGGSARLLGGENAVQSLGYPQDAMPASQGGSPMDIRPVAAVSVQEGGSGSVAAIEPPQASTNGDGNDNGNGNGKAKAKAVTIEDDDEDTRTE